MKIGGCSSKQEAGSKPGIFAMVAKISLGLREFRNRSKKFAILAKFSLCENCSRLAKFLYLAKFTVPSENIQFRYLTKISIG